MRTIVDLACVPPFTCRATLFSARVSAEETRALLEEACRTHVRVDDDHLAVRLVEPLELLAAAHKLTTDGFSLRAFAATPPAMELLRDDVEPTRTVWQTVRESLQLELPDGVATFVAAEGVGYLELEAHFDDFLARPVLVLDEDPRTPERQRSLFDEDTVQIGSLSFERDLDGWFVRELEARTRFSARERKLAGSRQLHVNGCSVQSPHRLVTGDRVSLVSAHRRHYAEVDVWAII